MTGDPQGGIMPYPRPGGAGRRLGAFTTNLSSPKAVFIDLNAIIAVQDDGTETILWLAGVANTIAVTESVGEVLAMLRGE